MKFPESQEEFQIIDHLKRDFKTVSIDGMLEGWRQTNLFLKWKDFDAIRKSDKPARLDEGFNQLVRLLAVDLLLAVVYDQVSAGRQKVDDGCCIVHQQQQTADRVFCQN